MYIHNICDAKCCTLQELPNNKPTIWWECLVFSPHRNTPEQGHQNWTKEAWENEEDIYDDLEVNILGWFQTSESFQFLWEK